MNFLARVLGLGGVGRTGSREVLRVGIMTELLYRGVGEVNHLRQITGNKIAHFFGHLHQIPAHVHAALQTLNHSLTTRGTCP